MGQPTRLQFTTPAAPTAPSAAAPIRPPPPTRPRQHPAYVCFDTPALRHHARLTPAPHMSRPRKTPVPANTPHQHFGRRTVPHARSPPRPKRHAASKARPSRKGTRGQDPVLVLVCSSLFPLSSSENTLPRRRDALTRRRIARTRPRTDKTMTTWRNSPRGPAQSRDAT